MKGYIKRMQADNNHRRTRPDRHVTFLRMALFLSTMGTCSRRQVGAIATNDKHHIVSSGYNGNASGLSHCIDKPCKGVFYESGKGLEICEAIHAEQNMLMQCQDVSRITNVYVTTPPCLHCVKLLLNTSCSCIHTIGNYDERSKTLWLDNGRQWVEYDQTA